MNGKLRSKENRVQSSLARLLSIVINCQFLKRFPEGLDNATGALAEAVVQPQVYVMLELEAQAQAVGGQHLPPLQFAEGGEHRARTHPGGAPTQAAHPMRPHMC